MTEADPFAQPYLDVVERVVRLALDAEDRLDVIVPACPDWTARATLAHLAGLAEDWVAGRLDDYGSDDWAAAQVGRLAPLPTAQILTSWSASAERLAAMVDSPLGGTPSMWAFGDAVVHEADLRPAIAPGSRVPDEPAAMGLKAGIARWRHHLGVAGLDPLLIRTPDGGQWKVGNTDTGPVTTVTTERYELFRALFGRRSRLQVAAWDWQGEAAPYLDAGLPGPFRWADGAIED